MWADKYIEELKQGRSVSFRPRGKSMEDIDANENGERGSPYFGDCRYGKVMQ